MRLFLLAIFSFSTKAATAQYLWQFLPDTVIKWSYYDGDEFNTSLDEQKWRVGFPWSNKILSQRTLVSKQNVRIHHGELRLVLEKKDSVAYLYPHERDSSELAKNKLVLLDSNQLKFDYLGAFLWSMRGYKYGYYELKFKGVQGKEIWPAFWLYGGNPNYEIDFFELKGEQPNDVHVDIHCPDGCNNYSSTLFGKRISYGHWVKLNCALSDAYQVLGAVWTPTDVTWYLNGQLIAHAVIKMDIAMGLSIGTGIANTHKKAPKKNAPVFPNTFTVDYLRIYRHDTLPDTRYLKQHLPNQVLLASTTAADFGAIKTKAALINSKPYTNSFPITTLSVNQIAKNTIQLRVLGQRADEQIEVRLAEEDKAPFTVLKLNGNKEIAVDCKEAKQFTITLLCKGKVVTQAIQLD